MARSVLWLWWTLFPNKLNLLPLKTRKLKRSLEPFSNHGFVGMVFLSWLFHIGEKNFWTRLWRSCVNCWALIIMQLLLIILSPMHKQRLTTRPWLGTFRACWTTRLRWTGRRCCRQWWCHTTVMCIGRLESLRSFWHTWIILCSLSSTSVGPTLCIWLVAWNVHFTTWKCRKSLQGKIYFWPKMPGRHISSRVSKREIFVLETKCWSNFQWFLRV